MATTSVTLQPRAATHGAPPGRLVSRMLVYAAAVLVLLVTGLPYLFMFVTALKAPSEFIANLWGLPRGLALSNFSDAIAGGFGRYFVNSVLVSVVSVVLTILLASLASYPLARMRFRLGRPLFLLFLAGSMIPVHVTLIPIYVLSKGLGIYDSLWALLGPYIGFQLPISVFILTEFFRGIPREIEEAARIDGAGNWGVFQHVTLPLMRGVIRTAAILSLIGSLKYFDLIWVMTGGVPNKATELMATYMYKQAFEQYRMGYASSVAVVLFLIAFVISSAVLIVDQRRSSEG